MTGKTRLQNIGSRIEGFVDGGEGKVTRRDSVIAAQNFFENRPRAGFQLPKLWGLLDRFPSVPLIITRLRCRRADSDKKHGQ